MKLLFELSGEHEELPMAELLSVLEGEGVEAKITHCEGRIVVIDAETEDCEFVKRLAMTKRVSEILFESKSLKDIVGDLFDRISDFDSFRVRCKSKLVEKELGGLLHEFGLEVDLKNPDVVVTCDILEGVYFVGLNVPLIRDFEVRKPQLRPYFHPTSMHPKIARTLVNLARVRKGDTLLDPFCGTGGILIEAALMGIRIVGWDIDNEMVQGCGKNLRHYGLTGKISKRDALSARDIKVDAIVTDPPYGRSSFVSKESSIELYNGFLRKARGILDKGCYMVIVIPKGYEVELGEFDIIGRYDIRMHKSLTRRVYVLT